jgi:ABC-type nickel/cobalt efflux system permease component RcnA
MTKKILSHIAIFTIPLLPTLVFAQATDFKSAVGVIVDMIKSLIPLVVALTLLVFVWGVFQLVRSNDEDSRKEALAIITYGIVSLFVMVSVWGLVGILTSTFFTGEFGIPKLK